MPSKVNHFMAFFKGTEMTEDVSEQHRTKALVATTCVSTTEEWKDFHHLLSPSE
jgi:hypothetical protein